MPDLFFPITEPAPNILDPLESQIVNTVLRRLGVLDYFGTSIYINTNRSASSLTDDGQGNINLQRNRCDATVVEIFNPANVTWDRATNANQTAYGSSPMYRKNYTPIFSDPVAKVMILEHTMPAALNFTFKLRFLSHDAAAAAFSALLGQQHGTVVTIDHDIVYAYPVTLRMLMALSMIHKNRTSFSGDFNSYLTEYSTVDWHREIRKLDLGTLSTESQLTVQRQQLRCKALLEFNQDGPEVERSGGLARFYSFEFTYKVQFGRPNLLQLVLPCVVENKALPEALFPYKPLNIVDVLQNAIQQKSFQLVSQELNNTMLASSITRLPRYDDFNPPTWGMLQTAGYCSFVSAAFTLDIPGPTIIPFETLDVYKLHPIVVDIIKLHTSNELLGYQGLFNLTIFADGVPLDIDLITVDTQTLSVSINATVLTKNYHLVLSEAGNLQWVLPKWYPVLLQYRFFFPMFIERNLNQLLSNNSVQVLADPSLIALIGKLMRRGLLDRFIQTMIDQHEATYHLYSYTYTATQFGNYISLTQAMHTKDKTLYDLFVSACITAGYITSTSLPMRSLYTPAGYPSGPGQGGFNAFSLPLRIFNVTIQPRDSNTDTIN